MDEERRSDLRGSGNPLKPDRRPFAIVNPAAGHGRGARRIPIYLNLLQRWFGEIDHAATTFQGSEAGLVDQALAHGADLIVAVGGDGTWSHVADRILTSGRSDVTLGLLAAGTGNDFAKSFGLSYGSPEEAVAAIVRGKTERVDVGRVTWASEEARHFLNVVGFGFDIAVIDAARGARFLKGDLLYQVTALRQLFAFPGLPLELSAPGTDEVRGRHLMLTISNGKVFGGSFRIAPRADVQDGLLDACAIRDAGPLTRAKLFRMVAAGTHEGSDFVEVRRSSSFVVRFDRPERFEVDGDVYAAGSNEVKIEVVPGALRVVVP